MASRRDGSPAPATGAGMSHERILVAFDGTEPSFWALQQAADAAEGSDVEIGIITVLPPVVEAPQQALRYLAERGIEATVHTPMGDPATEIARVAENGAYHTIYLGRREGSLGRTLGPSVSRRVALHAPANVLIAR